MATRRGGKQKSPSTYLISLEGFVRNNSTFLNSKGEPPLLNETNEHVYKEKNMLRLDEESTDNEDEVEDRDRDDQLEILSKEGAGSSKSIVENSESIEEQENEDEDSNEWCTFRSPQTEP